MPVLPAIMMWALCAVGAAVAARLFNQEGRRVNADLDRVRPVKAVDPERAGLPTLRRDPVTGEYRPYR